MGFGNPRGQLAKLILPRTARKGSPDDEENEMRKPTDDAEEPVPLVLTHRLNVGSVENESVEDGGVYALPTDAMGMPNFHMASPSPKGHCQKKFFDDHAKEQPWMLENRLKGLFNNFRSGPNKHQACNGAEQRDSVRTSPKRKNTSKRSLVPSLHSPRDPREVDERTHLILDAAIADEWSERQLAFDLESVVEDNSSSLMWMIHSDEDEDVTLSSPPPECRSPLLTIDTDFASDLDQPLAARRRSSRRSSSRSRRLLQYSPQLATVFEEEEGEDFSSRTGDTEFFSFDDSFETAITGTDNEEL
jgi:hypothetical protein